jgi:uncharacterized protein (TIGR00297 family)
MLVSQYMVLVAIAVAAFFTVTSGKLTLLAAITGCAIAYTLFIGTAFVGLTMMTAFFIMGTAATSLGIKQKEQAGLAESNKGRRTSGQVLANAGVTGLLALLAWLYKDMSAVFILGIAASFASATADTLSSELGNVYGRKFYNILTLKRDTKGLDGVVSIEGTLAGIAGSTIIALIYAFQVGFNVDLIIIILAGIIGNLADSVLGATLERSKYLNNNAVNFINTCIAALAGFIMYFIMHK